MNFSLKIIKNDKMAYKVNTHKLRRFLKISRLINWQDLMIKVYLKVDYGKFENCFGKMTNFFNYGEYDNKEDFWLAFNAFTEED